MSLHQSISLQVFACLYQKKPVICADVCPFLFGAVQGGCPGVLGLCSWVTVSIGDGFWLWEMVFTFWPSLHCESELVSSVPDKGSAIGCVGLLDKSCKVKMLLLLLDLMPTLGHGKNFNLLFHRKTCFLISEFLSCRTEVRLSLPVISEKVPCSMDNRDKKKLIAG